MKSIAPIAANIPGGIRVLLKRFTEARLSKPNCSSKRYPTINKIQNALRRNCESENGERNHRSSAFAVERSVADERVLSRRDSRNAFTTNREKSMPYVAERASRTTLNPARSIGSPPRRNENPLSASIISVRRRMQIAVM